MLNSDENYLTAPEVAELLRLPVKTLYTWRYKGFGPPAARIGKKLLYRAGAVRKWELDREVDSAKARSALTRKP